nr:saccharopine dehydrogenase NADP-binding domain-containing protein [Nocardia arizonensis]
MRTRVLLLGATGAVGRACLRLLAADPRVVVTVAGRRAVGGHPPPAADHTLDLAAIASDGVRLLALAKDADVVVNCAGPSHAYSRSVATVVMLCGAAYVDPGLDRATMEQLRRRMPGDGVAVVQTGVQPGVSGLALRMLAEQLGGTADRMTAWCGGLQPLTPAAVAEYLNDLGGRGASTLLRHGVRAPVSPARVSPPPPGVFPDSARGHAHLDDEVAEVASHLGVPDVEWVNVTDAVRTEHAIRRWQLDGAAPDPASIEQMCAAARLDLFGRRPYFTLFARASRGAREAGFLLRTHDSYALTGAVTAWAATAATAVRPGIHPLWSVPEAGVLVRELPRRAAGTELLLGADTAVPPRPTYEEGAL